MIELESDPGLPAGQRVEVVILPVPRERMPSEGTLKSAGALADAPDFEAHTAQIERERKLATSREPAE